MRLGRLRKKSRWCCWDRIRTTACAKPTAWRSAWPTRCCLGRRRSETCSRSGPPTLMWKRSADRFVRLGPTGRALAQRRADDRNGHGWGASRPRLGTAGPRLARGLDGAHALVGLDSLGQTGPTHPTLALLKLTWAIQADGHADCLPTLPQSAGGVPWFWDSQPFSRCNAALEARGEKPIVW